MDKLESLLDSYYGMQDEETAAAEAHNLDSASFNPAALASEMLQRQSLPELINYSNMIMEESKALDREMQDLVYNNYNKFISATDTIRRMKDSVGEMETAMNKLVTDMHTMGGSSASVNKNLQDNRSKIEKLVGVKRLLTKLEFLFELPVRLKRAMELDAQGQAVQYYTMVSGVLLKYDHMPSLHKIRVEADAIMSGLRKDLRGVLNEKTTGVTSSRVVEAIKLLVELDEPRRDLRAAYLTFQRRKLMQSLQQHAAKYVPSGAGAAAVQQGYDSAVGLISDRAVQFLKQQQAIVGYGPAMLITPRPRATVSGYVFMQGLNRTFLDGFKYCADLFVELFESTCPTDTQQGAEERKAAHEELVAFTKEIFGEYFTTVKQQLSLAPAIAQPANQADSATPSVASASARAQSDAGAGSKKGDPFRAKPKKHRDGKDEPAAVEADVQELDEDEVAANKAKAEALAAAAALQSESTAPEGRYTPVTDALKLLLTDIRSAARNVKEAQLIDRAHEVTESVLRAQVDGLFADVRVDVVKLLGAMQEQTTKTLDDEKKRAVRESAPEVEAHAAEASAAVPSRAAAPPPAAGTGNPFGPPTPAAPPGAGNPFASPHYPLAQAMAAASDRARVTSKMLPAAQKDWTQIVGAALAAAAEQASTDVMSRIDDALFEAKPLVLNGMRLLPDLARVFSSLLHGQVLNMLMWLASAWEALGDPYHPCRAEYQDIVVEADLGLDRETGKPPASKGGHAASGSHGRPGAHASKPATAAASNHAHALKRRVIVNFAAAEIDGGSVTPSSSFTSGAALLHPEKNPAFLLLLAVLCRHFSMNGVTRALSTMLQSLPTRQELQQMGIAPDSEQDSYGSMADVPDLIKRTQAAGKELLRRYIFQHATKICNMIRKSMVTGDWLAHREPRDVRLVVELVLDELAQIKKLAACALKEWDPMATATIAGLVGIGAALAPPAQSGNPFANAAVSLKGGPAAGTAPSTLAAAAAARRTGAVVGASGAASASAGAFGSGVSGRGMAMDIERLFRSDNDGGGLKVILGSVDYSADSIIKVLLRVIFKSLLEWIRTCTLGQEGYQQIQVDIAALHLALPFFTASPPPTPGGTASGGHPSALGGNYDPYSGAGQLEELLMESAISAADRCLDPKPLSASVIYDIAITKINSLQLAI